MNKKSNKFSPEVRERAVRMVQQHRGEYPSLWAAIESIAPKIGCVPQTLNEWVKHDQIDKGEREGLTTSERDRLKALKGVIVLSVRIGALQSRKPLRDKDLRSPLQPNIRRCASC